MGWLLDTHTLLWSLFEDSRLGAQARKRIMDPATDAALSHYGIPILDARK